MSLLYECVNTMIAGEDKLHHIDFKDARAISRSLKNSLVRVFFLLQIALEIMLL